MRKRFVVTGFVLLLVLIGGMLVGTTTAHAGALSFSGYLDGANPTDDHEVFFEQGVTVTARMICPDGSTLDPWLLAYDPNGTLIAQNDDYLPECDGLASFVTFTTPAAGTYRFRASSFIYQVTNGSLIDTGAYELIIEANDPSWPPTDGRLNCDAAAPVVLYCTGSGLDIMHVEDDGSSSLVLQVPLEDLVGDGETNVLVAQTADGSVSVYVLSTGEVQVNATNDSEEYVARWEGCDGTTHVELEVFSRANGDQLSLISGNSCAPFPLTLPQLGGENEEGPRGESDLPQ